MNGKTERLHRTLADGWAYARFYSSETERRAVLPALLWLHFYNHHRTHSAIGGPPHQAGSTICLDITPSPCGTCLRFVESGRDLGPLLATWGTDVAQQQQSAADVRRPLCLDVLHDIAAASALSRFPTGSPPRFPSRQRSSSTSAPTGFGLSRPSSSFTAATWPVSLRRGARRRQLSRLDN